MNIDLSPDKNELGRRAAVAGAAQVRTALAARGQANIIVATGASQFATLAELAAAPGLDWRSVNVFHLDEYIGLGAAHPASFRRYLRERFLARLPQPVAAFHAIDGEAEPAAECQRLGAQIARHPIDVAFIGIGENGHLAFNDPPADFETDAAYIVVALDEACRRQQLGEGWFAELDDMPRTAISMSIKQIMKSAALICSVPEARKAAAVRNCLQGEVSPLAPASVLQRHARAQVFLDEESCVLLDERVIG